MAKEGSLDLAAHLPAFGLADFRPGQREVIETTLAGRDCLCVMPTGGGKSLCYQLPAIVRPGLTLVVSPLIALMKDQVDALVARGLPATLINSTISPEEQARRLERMSAGDYRLVYIVPERFRSPRFVEAARASDVRLLAVDEAHCVSEWGHDFRPDYARLGRFRAQLGNPPTIALTATATDAVRRDIVELLNLRDPKIFITGFARPNLFYGVQACAGDREKDETLFRFLAENPGSGIVYASTRKRCEALGEKIAATTKRPTSIYHAGMSTAERRAAQEDFMQGRTEIAVATLAFGMGIDKANVRFVVHYNLPGSVEAYYQEAGRAGRDGLPSQCLLLLGGGDRRIHEFFIESAYPARDVVERVYDFLRGLKQNPIEMTQQEVKESLALQIGTEGIGACEQLLEAAGVLERMESSQNAAAVRLASDLPTLVDLLPQQAKVRRRVLRAVEGLVGAARYEWRYFQPSQLLRMLPEMDSTDLGRHLRELTELDAVEYVPPFRGRAIHMRRRDQPFAELEIDFEALERQKAAEYERIDRLVQFARDYRCRQQYILRYFGEAEPATCGHCDNCAAAAGTGRNGAPQPLDARQMDAVRIVLSGVARVSRTRRYGCGKQLLAQMLCGSNSKSVARNRLDKLSTFGLLSYLAQTQVVQLIDALLMAGLLEQTEIEPFRPVVQLTARGVEVMHSRDDTEVRLSLATDLALNLRPTATGFGAEIASSDVAGESTAEPGLVQRLRQWRDQQRLSENVPAYRVLTNALIDELARLRPRSSEGLLAVKGMGPAKVRQYGEQLLEVLAADNAHHAAPVQKSAPVEESTPIDAPAPVESAAPIAAPAPAVERRIDEPASSGGPPPSHYWTWRLLSAGLSPDECAAARNLEPEMVLDHALRAAEQGMRIDARWFLAEESIARIERELQGQSPGRIRAILERLPRGTRYEEVQLVLKSRRANAHDS